MTDYVKYFSNGLLVIWGRDGKPDFTLGRQIRQRPDLNDGFAKDLVKEASRICILLPHLLKQVRNKMASDINSMRLPQPLERDYPQEMRRYEYNPIDITRLLRLMLFTQVPNNNMQRFRMLDTNDHIQGAEVVYGTEPIPHNYDGTDVIHRLENRYILPPVTAYGNISQHGYRTPTQQLINVLERFFRSTTLLPIAQEIIVPFNPGGHWVTLRIIIDPARINIEYVDSLFNGISAINEAKEQSVKERLGGLQDFLQTQYQQETRVILHHGRLQPDDVACGITTVATIHDLAQGQALQELQLTPENIRDLRVRQRSVLQREGLDLDFDQPVAQPQQPPQPYASGWSLGDVKNYFLLMLLGTMFSEKHSKFF